MNHRLSAERGSAAKIDDVAGEQRRRRAALDTLRVAIDDETRVRDEAARASAARARDAVWCGASLADLAVVTGHSRQAARKRWPGLGGVQRRRSWLGRQSEGVVWAAEQLVAEREALAAGAAPGFGAALDALELARSRVAALAADLDGAATPAFWLALDDLVDGDLRRCVALAGSPADATSAAFALHGARSVVGYYDHATRPADTAAATGAGAP